MGGKALRTLPPTTHTHARARAHARTQCHCQSLTVTSPRASPGISSGIPILPIWCQASTSPRDPFNPGPSPAIGCTFISGFSGPLFRNPSYTVPSLAALQNPSVPSKTSDTRDMLSHYKVWLPEPGRALVPSGPQVLDADPKNSFISVMLPLLNYS